MLLRDGLAIYGQAAPQCFLEVTAYLAEKKKNNADFEAAAAGKAGGIDNAGQGAQGEESTAILNPGSWRTW